MKKLLTLWVLLVSFALCVNAQTYISAVKVGGGSKDAKTSKSRATNGGYTLIDRDLNEKASGSYVYLSYKTTTNPTLAISDIIIFKGKQWQSDWYLSNGVTVNGKKYYLAPYENKDADWGDLNDGAGGSYLYVFYTRDFSPTRITSLAITSNAGLSVKQYDGSNIYNSINLNEGAGGTTMYLQVNRSGCTHERMLYSECPDCGYKAPAFYETHTFDPNDNSRCTHCDHVFVQYRGYERIMPNVKQPFGDATIITNTFADGKGYYELDKAPTKIENEAFMNNTNLLSLNFAVFDGITSIGDNAFYHCGMLMSDLYLSNTLKTIGDNAFNGANISGDLTIPNSVTSIGDSAFYNCNMSGKLTLSNSLEKIGKASFAGAMSLKGEINLPATLKSIGRSAFYGCIKLTGSLNIPNSLTCIEDSVFCGCSGLNGTLTIPNTVKSIGKSGFQFCRRMTGNIVLPEALMSLGDSAFLDCRTFTGDLVIPNAIKNIGNVVFGGCSGLNGALILHDKVETIGEAAFSNCGFTAELHIPKSVTKIGNLAFCCDNLKKIYCESEVPAEIGGNSFECSDGLCIYVTRASYGKYVYEWSYVSKYIKAYPVCDNHVFSTTNPNECSNCGASVIRYTTTDGKALGMAVLYSAFGEATLMDNIYTENGGYLILDNKPTEINYIVFRGLTTLKTIDIPNTVTEIKGDAFKNCINLAGITLPNSLIKIGESAFEGCTNMRGNLIIPSSVEYIASHAFYGCGLDGILEFQKTTSKMQLNLESFGGNKFKYVVCNSVKPYEAPPSTFLSFASSESYIYVPNNAVNDYKYSDYGWYVYRTRIKSMNQIPVYELGDVDGNNKMGVGDIAALISILNGKSGDVYDTADMNGDGKIDVKDLEVLKDVLLNGVPLVQGKFSVSATKQVQFTSGNLYWDGGQYRIEKNQTDFPTTKTASHVGNFYWTSLADYQSGKAEYMPYAENYAFSTQSYDDKFFCGEENPLTVDGLKGLYAMSNDEWKYLLNSRANADKLYKVGVLVNGKKNCLVIAPDDFKGTLKSSYTLDELNAQGLVCLPAAGSYYGSGNFSYNYNGYYWTMSAFGIMKDCGEIMKTTSDEAGTAGYSRYCGCSIRLVRTAE